VAGDLLRRLAARRETRKDTPGRWRRVLVIFPATRARPGRGRGARRAIAAHEFAFADQASA
jgi:hypothetical protein